MRGGGSGSGLLKYRGIEVRSKLVVWVGFLVNPSLNYLTGNTSLRNEGLGNVDYHLNVIGTVAVVTIDERLQVFLDVCLCRLANFKVDVVLGLDWYNDFIVKVSALEQFFKPRRAQEFNFAFLGY